MSAWAARLPGSNLLPHAVVTLPKLPYLQPVHRAAQTPCWESSLVMVVAVIQDGEFGSGAEASGPLHDEGSYGRGSAGPNSIKKFVKSPLN